MAFSKDPHDWVRVERIRGRGPLTLQAIVGREFTYKMSAFTDSGDMRDEKLPLRDVEGLFEMVARAQEPKATPARVKELVGRIIDRTWNAPVLYMNKVTGEVTT